MDEDLEPQPLAPRPPPADVAALREALLTWYRAHRRDLPWRRTRDPYAIWVSEVMLQQTRVATAIPYFERFLGLFPTVEALASADPAAVRAAWSGLGYYRRARAMMEAARCIQERGQFPDELADLRALPGFGPYTAGAVASIAYDRPVAAVDGNVARVLARVGRFEGDERSTRRRIEALASRLAPGEAPGELNQALIELGALVCRPRPACARCPIASQCVARAHGLQDAIPPPKRRQPKKPMSLSALVLVADGRVLLRRRPESGLFGGMWCPPLEEDGSPKRTELAAGPLRPLGRVEHVLTHRHLDLEVLGGAPASALLKDHALVAIQELPRLALPSLAVKLLELGLPEPPSSWPGRAKPQGSFRFGGGR